MKSITLIISAFVALSGIVGAQEKEAKPAGPSDSAKTAIQKLPRLVDLGASKCVPCKMMAPILEGLKKEFTGRMDVEFIDVWQNPDAGKEYGIRVIPTQIFYKLDGKEAFRHEGFFGKEDILAKWKELGVDLSGSKPSAGIIREVPVKADTRSKNEVCFMCDGDINSKTLAVVKGQSEERRLCSPHCYFIYLSSIMDADVKAEESKVSVTDWVSGNLIPAAAAATYLYGVDDKGRATIKSFATRETAAKEQQSSPGNLVTWDVLRAKELGTRCGFCDRAVYPEDACTVKLGEMRTNGCCTHCSLGIAARLQKDIEVEAKDGLTGELIRVKTLNGSIASLEPSTAVAWFGQKQGPDGKWTSAGCFKQGFFANEANLQKWLDSRPAMTGREITIAKALADKMQLSQQQIAKACKLGECK